MWWTSRVDEQEVLATTYEQRQTPMTRRDWVAEAVVGAGFVSAEVGLFVLAPPPSRPLGPALLALVLLVLATRVRFDTPFGFTVATELAFVPLLFALPTALVPAAVAAAFVLAALPDVVRGRTHPSRLLLSIGNSSFALGPAAVFALAGVAPEHAGLLVIGGSLAAQFLVDFALSSVRLAIAREADLASQLRDTWAYLVDAALFGVGLAVAQDMSAHPYVVLATAPLLGLLAMFARERRDRLQSLLELGNAYRGTALVLGDVVEADDAYTGEHCKGVVALALAVGESLNLPAEQRRNLEFGALLHDVGKVAIPKEIINKPGRLDPHEWQIIKTHTVEGQRMLDRVGGFMREVGLIVRSHHERWDGTGYPDGLAGEAIPLEARIITCCDSWNAMRTDRSYRRALAFEVAVAELRANAGGQFDPRVVETLITLVAPDTETRSSSTARGELVPAAPPAASARRPGAQPATA